MLSSLRQRASISKVPDTAAEVAPSFELSNSVIREGLSELFETWGIEPGPRAWKRAAEVLGRRARGEAYSARYIVSIWNSNGSYRAGEPFRRALLQELALLDGSHPIMILTTEVSGRSLNSEADGALFDSLVRTCRNPECLTRFSPNTPRRIYCYVCSPPKKERV